MCVSSVFKSLPRLSLPESLIRDELGLLSLWGASGRNCGRQRERVAATRL